MGDDLSVAVVADGGPAVGLGHLGRSSAVAAALRARGVAVECVAYGAMEPLRVGGIDWAPGAVPDAPVVLLDSYTMPSEQRAALAARGPLAVMHDYGDVPDAARLIVSVGGDDTTDDRVLAGLRFAPLRPEYWNLEPRVVRQDVRRILVTTGGGALRAAGVATAEALAAAYPEATVALVRGPYADFEPPAGVELVDAPASLVSELMRADVVVTAAGQTALESAATGAATVAVALVDNQRRNARALERAGAACVPEPDGIVAAVGTLDRVALAQRGQRAVDGRGALRIADRVAALLRG